MIRHSPKTRDKNSEKTVGFVTSAFGGVPALAQSVDTAWVRRYTSSGYNRDRANAIVVDDSGNVYVTRESTGEETNYDFATIKYFEFLRGDVDKNGEVNVVDAVYLINYVFNSGPDPVPIIQAGDVNCDGVVDIVDVVYLINYLFRGGLAPCQ